MCKCKPFDVKFISFFIITQSKLVFNGKTALFNPYNHNFLKMIFKVKLVGISNYDIVDGKSTTILGLIWSIILRFQVQYVTLGLPVF